MPGARIPVEVDDLTPEWFSEVLQRDITRIDVLDRHSGTTGRVRLTLFDAADLPGHVFVKLPPFDAEQRAFVNAVGMGVTEARFYRDLAGEVGLRVPESLYAEFSSEDGYVMVLEDLEASGCRFPAQDDVDIEFRARDIVEQLAGFHARYWESDRFAADGDLAWISPKSTGQGDGGATFVRMAVDGYADRLPDEFRPLAELYVQRSRDILPLYRQGPRTLVHGDAHLGNLFVDGTRTGFLDWAVIAHAPGIRDVAYVLCNSIPTEVRRAHERPLVERYCELLSRAGITYDFDAAWAQYRLFCCYAWVAATCTLGMGSKWQPEHIGLAGTTRATIAATDLGLLELLETKLG
ncbi:MAG: phosphotransferase family protein, partial [Acidimicrobiia bacterium]